MESLFSFGFLALPTVFITLSLAGALLALVWRRAGLTLALVSGFLLYAAAMPTVSSWLMLQCEAELPQNVDLGGAQAIVVLGGDVRRGDGSDIPDRLGPLSIERLILAADAYRRLLLPVAVTGGPVPHRDITEAALMKAALEAEFRVPVRWSEARSRTTWENAVFTAQLLQPEKVTTVILVSHAWHLPRALWAFERVGLKALPWPAPRTPRPGGLIGDFLPSTRALNESFDALHELIGAVYYRLRH